MTKPDPRAIALQILEQILDQRQALDHVLETHKGLALLESRDRGFVRLLVTTTLRRLGTLDHAIDSALARKNIPIVARHVLRLALVQLRYLGTPPHAAISTAVDLVGGRVRALKGLVNAILRKQDTLIWDEAPHRNFPRWLWERWVKQYGPELTEEIAAALLVEPKLDITVKSDPTLWAKRLNSVLLPSGTLRRENDGIITALPGYEEGEWWIQDLAASLPAKLIGPVTGKIVYDLCAAPGGKTAQLANFGAQIIAVDRSAPRLQRLRQNLTRLHLTAQIQEADATRWQAPGLADAILLDAPCLATGTIRRHPDIPFLKTAEDLRKLVLLQTQLIDHAATLLKPGGTLIYCTCSLEREEGEDQVTGLQSRKTPLSLDPILPGEMPGLESLLTRRGEVRALPSHLPLLGGIDGFYIARFKRN